MATYNKNLTFALHHAHLYKITAQKKCPESETKVAVDLFCAVAFIFQNIFWYVILT